MTIVKLRGMTWDHPRGYDPLVECSALYLRERNVEVTWEKRSLQDFESFPVDELARRYDLIVIDHPHVGQVAREGCLTALDQPNRGADRVALLAGSVGLSYHSYIYDRRLWALPLDAATQVQSWRPDRIERAPATWREVMDLAREQKVILPLRPPHSLMCIMTLAANLGWTPGGAGSDFLPRDIGDEALGFVADLVPFLDETCWSADPIAVLDELASSNRLACCPLVYGYVSYGLKGFRPWRLGFADIPVVGSAGPIGSVLGGTGLAVSARCADPEAAIDFAYWITSSDVQKGPYAAAGGQPGHDTAWVDSVVNERTNDFFSATRATLKGAILRPRHNGYMAFQDSAARLISSGLQERAPVHRIRDEVNALYVKNSAAD